MNSAPQVQTVEISDAELDTVSGGVHPQVGIVAGPTAINSSDVLAQLEAGKGEAMSTLGQYHHVGVTVGF